MNQHDATPSNTKGAYYQNTENNDIYITPNEPEKKIKGGKWKITINTCFIIALVAVVVVAVLSSVISNIVTNNFANNKDVNECLYYPCHNHATCTNTMGNFTCTCSPGFTGWRCDLDINECVVNSPCRVGGKCTNTFGNYTCSCPTGTFGLNCEYANFTGYLCNNGNSNGKFNISSGTPLYDGWTVMQRRFDGTVSFQYKTWAEYSSGFGNYTSEFWLGLDKVHKETNLIGKTCEIQVDLCDFQSNTISFNYGSFKIGTPADKYRLTMTGYIQTSISNAMTSSNGQQFSTLRQGPANIAQCLIEGGPWWYGTGCGVAFLNGKMTEFTAKQDASTWYYWLRNNKNMYGNIKATMMRFRCAA